MRTVRFLPKQFKPAVAETPRQVDMTGLPRQGAVLCRVGGELVQRQRDGLGGRRRKHDNRPAHRNPLLASGPIGSKFFIDKPIEIGAFPTRACKQSVSIRQRADAAIQRPDIVVDGVCPRQPHDRLDDRDDVTRAMIDFLGEQYLAFFGALAVGDVGSYATKPDQASLLVEIRDCRAGAPSNLAVWAKDAEFGLEGVGVFRKLAEGALQKFEVIGADQRPHAVDGRHECAGVDAEDLALALVPYRASARDVPLPAPHLAGGERQAAQALALPKLPCGGGESGGALGDPRLELAVELLELPGLAIELNEDLDLRAQHLGDHRHRDIVDRAHFVATQPVDVGEQDRRDEY